MATKTYSLSKKKVRETISEKFGTSGSVDVAEVLALFAGVEREAGSTLVEHNGEVVGKRCSYSGKFFEIEEFGKRGGNYAYQCKAAEAAVRKQRSEAIKLKADLDAQLEDGAIDVNEWKEGLTNIEEIKSTKVEIDGGYETADELLASIA